MTEFDTDTAVERAGDDLFTAPSTDTSRSIVDNDCLLRSEKWSARHGSLGGYHEEDMEIWDAEGNLVAQSRQLALLGR